MQSLVNFHIGHIVIDVLDLVLLVRDLDLGDLDRIEKAL